MTEWIAKNDFGFGAQALRGLREATADICDVTALDAEDEFRVASLTVHLGKGLLLYSRGSAVQYDRTPTQIARSRVDHFQLCLCLDTMEFSSGRRTVTMRPGDLCLIDMAQTSRASTTGAERSDLSQSMSLVLPRALLAPLLASPDSATASLIARDTVQGRLLAEQFQTLRRRSEQLEAGEGAAAIDASAALLADAIGGRRDAAIEIQRANRRALMASIKTYIDAHLETDMLSQEKLSARFKLSRATLYRLFEPEGGLARYIQDQRLNRAFMKLVAPSSRETRIIDLAVDFHFSSDNTFVRAFRHRFGLTPGEVRQLAAEGSNTGPAGPGPAIWPWDFA
jgi:AraC-like DNA-binding protein